MTFLLDTSAYSAFNRGDTRLRKWFTARHDIAVPLIVIGELRAGFAVGSRRQENEQLLRQFLDAPVVRTVLPTEQTTRLYAEVYSLLRTQGTPIGTNDLWIAALALEQDAPLLTLDNGFRHIKGLKLLEV